MIILGARDALRRPGILVTGRTKRFVWPYAVMRNNKQRDDPNYEKTNVMSNEEIEYLGLLGEVPASRFLGLPWDRNFYAVGDDGFDFVTLKGMRIAVKYNHYCYGHLFIRIMKGDVWHRKVHKIRNSDIIVAVNGNCGRKKCVCKEMDRPEFVHISGIVYVDDFLRRCEPRDYGYDAKWTLPFDALTPIRGPRDILDLNVRRNGHPSARPLALS